jgi:hypothetical protein
MVFIGMYIMLSKFRLFMSFLVKWYIKHAVFQIDENMLLNAVRPGTYCIKCLSNSNLQNKCIVSEARVTVKSDKEDFCMVSPCDWSNRKTIVGEEV